MLYLALFDFVVLALVLSTLTFFVLCWFAFREDRKSHPIYRNVANGEILLSTEQQERRCA